jgi:DNA-directed RNA polymerase subunit alpha
MGKISLPQKVNFIDGAEANQGIVEIEPCYPGYGMTLGNALRRVLLSSLPGAAVIGVKIKGVSHEFSTLPHVKEDILEIILNLKKLRIKIFEKDEDEELRLELKVHGKKEVKASDITKNSKVEIVNGDLVIANITDMAGSLEMELFVDKGRGYRPVESIENKKNEIGYIDIDSIFSPVFAVGIKVENVRVGKMTNWDKLVLDIVTDGTLTPKEAFEKSNQILIDQFSAIIGLNNKKDEEEEVEQLVEKNEETDEKEESEDSDQSKKRRGRPKKE